MGYHHFAVEDIDPTPSRPSIQRSIADTADLENVAVNQYEAEPGEAIPLAYHYHDEQEELFYVLDGQLRVETPETTHEVTPGEIFIVEPGNPHYATGSAAIEATTRVLAVGAPNVEDAHAYEESE